MILQVTPKKQCVCPRGDFPQAFSLYFLMQDPLKGSPKCHLQGNSQRLGAYLDVQLLEVNGAKVIGSVGEITLRNTPVL